jgi:hypothetical protein
MKLLITYRLIGGTNELTKEFDSEAEYQAWKSQQVNVCIVSKIEIQTLSKGN